MKKLLFTLLISSITIAQNKIESYQIINSEKFQGIINRIDSFPTKFIVPRTVDVWLPSNYSKAKKYSVLYMHDGQMLFDENYTWNKEAWNVDDIASELLKADKVKNLIVVGIWNGGQTRHIDYFPQKPFKSLSSVEKDTIIAQLQRVGRVKDSFMPQSDNYLKFLVKELKPYIDKTYSVYTDRENTYLAGSSMGGLISIYGICEYPQIFGGAACLSTHWVGSFTTAHNPFPNAMLNYLSKNLPSKENHKIYFDCGDQTLDALYPAIQNKVDLIMKSKGFDDTNWLTKYFPGENHSEKAWSKRLRTPITFLLR